MASALWVMRRCHLVHGQMIYFVGTLNNRGCWSVNSPDGFVALRHLIRDRGRHQLVDLGSVF